MPPLLSSRLLQRTLSAIMIMPVVVAAVLYGGLPFVILVAVNIAVVLYEWYYLALRSPYKYALMVAGLFYTFLAFGAGYLIRDEYGVRYALLFVIMIWASDIGAYVTGKLIGGPKLAVSISPNKTWAGLIGAAVFPVICANIFLHTYDYFYSHQTWDGMTKISLAMFVIGGIIGVVGQAGDLLISCLKRHVGVKDTGTIIPGHGGLLDRVDALMLTAPVFLFFISQFTYVFEN